MCKITHYLPNGKIISNFEKKKITIDREKACLEKNTP